LRVPRLRPAARDQIRAPGTEKPVDKDPMPVDPAAYY